MITFTNSEILLVEDDRLLSKRLTAALEKIGASVTRAFTIEEARRSLSSLSFDFALVDINLPDGLGLDLLRERRFGSGISVVIMTADSGIETAVEAMRLGAGDYLTKPFDPAELPIVFQRCRQASRSARLQEHNREKKQFVDKGLFFGQGMRILHDQLDRILETDRRLTDRLPPVLIEGETGTGKTAIARWLHQHGPRSELPLVDINCSTLPDTLAESELFGHEKGAFTDARTARIGLFEAADGGTLFLDEIPSLSLVIQAKVLTAIEDGKIRRVGGSREIQVNVRLITATNRNLDEAVKAGQFRGDLLHRLNLLRLTIPPLNKRSEDIIGLADHLLEGLCKRYCIAMPSISERGKKRLTQYDWPGNVRELAHELERAIVFGDFSGGGEIHFEHITGPEQSSTELVDSGKIMETELSNDWFNENWVFPEEGFSLEDAINRIIFKALAQMKNNVSAAARLLGVPRDYVRYRLKNK